MATIIRRNNAFSVVYNYTDELGETRQKWESFRTLKDAEKRKAVIENGLDCGTFLPPTKQTIAEFLKDFVTMYGETQWGVSTYDGNTGLINNYVNPIIGHLPIQDFNAWSADKYIQVLRKTPPVSTQWRKAKGAVITDRTISGIVKVLRCAFKQAVRWELIGKNPFDFVNLPRLKYNKREIWTVDTISKALNACTDTKLYLAMNLSFACSCRIGEILGLTWDNVHISNNDIARDDAHILDEDRKINAQKFEASFYANPNLRGITAPNEPVQEAPLLSLDSLVTQLEQNPELARILASLLGARSGQPESLEKPAFLASS